MIGIGANEREPEGVRDPAESTACNAWDLISCTRHQIVSRCDTFITVGDARVRYSSSKGKNFSISGSTGDDALDVRTASYTLYSRLSLFPSSLGGRIAEELP